MRRWSKTRAGGVAAAGRGHRYRYYACFTRQRYGKDARDGERIRADVLEAAVLDALRDFYADPDLIRRAVAVKTQQAETSTRQHRDEIDAVTAEPKKTEAAIERYILAFEAGTISDDMFDPASATSATAPAPSKPAATNSKRPSTSLPPTRRPS